MWVLYGTITHTMPHGTVTHTMSHSIKAIESCLVLLLVSSNLFLWLWFEEFLKKLRQKRFLIPSISFVSPLNIFGTLCITVGPYKNNAQLQLLLTLSSHKSKNRSTSSR